MSSEAEDAVKFLQDLMVGKVTYDRLDAQHLRGLGAACQLVDDYARITGLVPELGQKIAGLKALKAGEQGDQLEFKIALLEELREALAERVKTLYAEKEALEAQAEEAAKSEADDYWVWGDAKAKPFDGVVAIDLGNTNVVCSHWNFQSSDPEVSSNEPVAVNVLDARGFHKLVTDSYKIGEKALRQRKQVNLYQSFRRWLGTQYKPRPAITGSEMIPVAVADLVGALIKHALQTVTAQVSPGGEPLRFPNVVVTVPASGDVAFEYELREIFDRLRVEGSAELDEATAAGMYSLLKPIVQRTYLQAGEQITPGAWYAKTYGIEFDGVEGSMDVLCVDVGGGTTDLSLLQFSILEDSRACRLTVEVIATSGFQDLSGEGLTLHLYGLLKRRLALAIADPQRALGGSAPTKGEHPWLEYHTLEGGAKAMYVPQHLEEDLGKVNAAWDTVASSQPLPAELTGPIDTLFPTISKDAARVGKKVRRVNFGFLWDEAERIKREITLERVGGDPGTVRRRLNLKKAKRQAKCVHAEAHVRAAGVDPTQPALAEALSVSSDEIDAYVNSSGQAVLAAIKDMSEGHSVRRVLLAGNGMRDARFAISAALSRDLGVTPDQIEFDPDEAKSAVSKGACLWAIGNRLEGIHVTILRRPRHPSSINLVSAVRNDELFKKGDPINRFCYVQPPSREGDDGSKLVQVDRVVAGQFKPFMMFRPAKDGRLLPDIADQPISKRADRQVANVDQFLVANKDGTKVDFVVRDAAQYLQMAVEWVSNWEMLEMLRKEMTMQEVISWIESAEHLQDDPPPGCAYHRYYMDETRELYLVYHAKGRKLIVEGEVTESARRLLPEELDPFSGVH